MEYMKMELHEHEISQEHQMLQMTNMYEEIVTMYEAGKTIGKILEINKIEEKIHNNQIDIDSQIPEIISISIFLMLLVKPIYLFDVGFQMSYLAVLAIVSVQPMLYKLWKTPNLVIEHAFFINSISIGFFIDLISCIIGALRFTWWDK